VIGLLAAACLSETTVDLHVASSADTSVAEVVRAFSLAHPLTPVTTNRGPSSQLARQIQQGIDADVFLSADRDWAEAVKSLATVDLLHNRIVPVGTDDGGCIAIADPDHVPAGRYAKRALGDGWSAIAARVVPLADGPAAARAVKMGTCASGYVYATDARQAGLVAGPAFDVEATYVLVLLSERGRPLYEALQSREARSIYAEHGFQ
jgi:molybdate transport system substrate-binding protein